MRYKLFCLNLCDKSTGDIVDLQKLTEGMSNEDIHQVVQKFLIAKEIYTEVSNIYRIIETHFLNKMSLEKATKYKNDDAIIKISPQSEYEYDPKLIDKLKELITEDDFNNTFTKKYKVNRTQLKVLKTLGGNVKDIINDMELKIERKSSITIEKKKIK